MTYNDDICIIQVQPGFNLDNMYVKVQILLNFVSLLLMEG
jgi:hypothetical protein